MLNARYVLLMLLPLALPVAAEHSALLPSPQEVSYGTGQLSLTGLSIQLPPDAASEDRFAARQLSACLSSRAGFQVPVATAAVTGRTILLSRTGPVAALAVPDEQPGPDSRESFSIKLATQGGEIRASSSAGLFYGVQTVCQMVEGDEPRLPEAEVRDWPSMAYRGTMVDLSEGQLPAEDEIKRQIDFLSRWKENQYYFYSETSIELEGYPLLNPGGRYTKSQIRSIIAYGRERHVDVIPCLELYGHLHDLFRLEKYSDLADFPHGGEFNPANLAVKKLLSNWIDQFSELFPSPFVHIGFDETWEIQKTAEQQGKGTTPTKLFIEQLNNVAQGFTRHGKRVMAWADIMVKYPEIVSQLPPGIIAVAWYYDPYEDKEYKHWLVPLVEHRVPHIVAPGVNSWSEIVPDYERSFENIDTFLAAGHKSHALGFMNTIWTDDSQMLMRQSWPGMAYGAAAAWQSKPVNRKQFFSDYAHLIYPGIVAQQVSSALESLAASELRLQKALGQDTMSGLWDLPFTTSTLERCTQHREDLKESRLLAESAQEDLYRAIDAGGDLTTLNSLLFGSRLLDYAGMKFLYAVETADRWHTLGAHPSRDVLRDEFVSQLVAQQHGRLPDLMDTVTELRPLYREAWLAEYTPYRMGSALGRWDAEYEYWRRLQTRLEKFAENYRPEQNLPSLESLMDAN